MLATLVLLASQSTVALHPYPIKGSLLQLDNGTGIKCSCLRLTGGAVDRERLSDEERVRFDDLMRHVADGWATADRRARARMLADYLQLGTLDRVTTYQDVVLSCSDGLRVRATKILTPRGESATALRDQTTGEYVLHLYATEGSPTEFVEALRAAVASSRTNEGTDSDSANSKTTQTMKELTQRYAKQLEVRLDSWDINGQFYMPLPDEKAPQVYSELTVLWTNFTPEAGRLMRTAWGILEAMDNGDIDCGVGAPAAAAPSLDPNYLLAAQPSAFSCQRDDSFWMRYPSFELPAEAPVEVWFGKEGWEPLPTGLSFAQSVKWLRQRR